METEIKENYNDRRKREIEKGLRYDPETAHYEYFKSLKGTIINGDQDLYWLGGESVVTRPNRGGIK
jgi:hypothetical protein